MPSVVSGTIGDIASKTTYIPFFPPSLLTFYLSLLFVLCCLVSSSVSFCVMMSFITNERSSHFLGSTSILGIIVSGDTSESSIPKTFSRISAYRTYSNIVCWREEVSHPLVASSTTHWSSAAPIYYYYH